MGSSDGSKTSGDAQNKNNPDQSQRQGQEDKNQGQGHGQSQSQSQRQSQNHHTNRTGSGHESLSWMAPTAVRPGTNFKNDVDGEELHRSASHHPQQQGPQTPGQEPQEGHGKPLDEVVDNYRQWLETLNRTSESSPGQNPAAAAMAAFPNTFPSFDDLSQQQEQQEPQSSRQKHPYQRNQDNLRQPETQPQGSDQNDQQQHRGYDPKHQHRQDFEDVDKMTLDPDLDSVTFALSEPLSQVTESVALKASGAVHDSYDDNSRESSNRFEPTKAVLTPRASSTSHTETPDQEQSQRQPQPFSSIMPFGLNLNTGTRSTTDVLRSHSSNGWMNRSRFRPYFNISLVGDSKIATCIYCGKDYKEGESTGNLSKHITNNHASEYKSRERAASKENTLTSLTSKERSLRLSTRFASELNRDSGTLASVILITETLVPFYVVESMGWKIINGLVPDVPLIETRKAVVEKLDHYIDCLNESLKASLESSTFVSVQLYVCSREDGLRYLAVSASYAPNVIGDERLDSIQSPELLVNNTGDPVNGHLLDVVEFNEKASDHPSLYQGVLRILDKYGITSKVALVTVDQLSHALGLHEPLMEALLSYSDSQVMRYLGSVRLSRCINSGLEMQFEAVARDLMKDGDFKHEYQKIEKLAKSWEKIPSLQSFADDLVSQPHFSSQVNEARGAWRKVTKFLRVRQRLKVWLESPDRDAEGSAVQDIEENISHTSTALELFRYFVDCCSIFDRLRGSLLTDGICFLPEGVFIYYKLNGFFDLCERASRGERIHHEEYSFLNGSDNLLPEHKERVLRAVLSSRKLFKGFFEGVKNNALFYVAVTLDPSVRLEDLQKYMTEQEMNAVKREVEVNVQEYLSKCDLYEHSSAKSEGSEHNKAPKRKRMGQEPSKEGVFTSSYDEWTQYKCDVKVLSKSRRGVIQWWFERRSKYPHLFKLAMALYYSQISSNETENIFYVTEHTLKVYQRSVGRANTQKVMLLRNRFKNFGLYNQALRFVNPSID
ncbi:putative transposase of the Rover hAT-like DNA transposon [Lachancea lanzarotensis]|uniref:LALA0S14e00958g1_1 n=1 Tax=Lachancea lanzarotensis TaxID=1245769 RepID=A0A0C7N3U6_9SACH|nr:putative transposase of the Rover hAT-like DNA transposon [Lachancea lanzarotensis]CEP64862.1 putative transposase of the Rover hAT-like DNA transposon [Lachancea lanzarotensis]